MGVKYFLAFLLTTSIAALWHAFSFRTFGTYTITEIARNETGGGFLGSIFTVPLVSFMGQVGTIVMLLTTTAILISATYDLSFAQTWGSVKGLIARIQERRYEKYYDDDDYYYEDPPELHAEEASPQKLIMPKKDRKSKKKARQEKLVHKSSKIVAFNYDKDGMDANSKPTTLEAEPLTTSAHDKIEEDPLSVLPNKILAPIVPSAQIEPGKIEVAEIFDKMEKSKTTDIEPKLSADLVESNAEIEPNVETEPINAESADVMPEELIEEVEPPKPPPKPYILPPLNLLNDPIPKNIEAHMETLESSAKKLLDTLESFGVSAKITDYSMGPTVTRYELQPKAGVKISKIVNLADDIALNLAAIGVRIEAPIPGKAAIGIEIPNEIATAVNIVEAISSKNFNNFNSKVAVALGMDISGQPVVVDIARMPHLLIAGSTGSGKSVCINTIITSLLFKAKPDEVKLILIDPKIVELGGYNGIPHLLIPVVTDPHKAAGALAWAVKEMTNRYKLFAQNNVRDLNSYNVLMESEEEDKLPQIVIIIDELADLMMVAPNDVEDAICRLAQMARAAGMHLVIATQRPSVDVITGVIKANIPSRISFAVSSQIDSRTILDMAGAEKLIGRGDMLYSPIGANKPIRVQGCFVSDSEVSAIVDYTKQFNQSEYSEEVAEEVDKFETSGKGRKLNGNGNGSDDDDDGRVDSLLPQAIEMAIETGQASVAMYQRRLKVGYQRAARLIDQMESRGIIGPFEGTKPRQILITRQQFHEMFMNEPAPPPA
jgi:S-DNA-T family DNA segregation ATPase FtsK/SpoIIIE